MLAAPQGYVCRLGDARGSKQYLAHCLSHYILRDGLLPTDALLLLHFSGRGVGGVGAPTDPLAGTLDASGTWLPAARPPMGAAAWMLVPGLGPMLVLQGLLCWASVKSSVLLWLLHSVPCAADARILHCYYQHCHLPSCHPLRTPHHWTA